MTEERYTTGSGDETDALVSQRYRELAQERTPEHLDRAVLGAAAKAARPRYSRLRSWTRPLAWAATVVLSVALVLEISKVPAPDNALFDVPTSDAALESNAAADASDRPGAPPEAESQEALTPVAAQPVQLLEETAALPDSKEQPVSTAAEEPAAEMEQLRPQGADMLKRAEEQARARAGESKASGTQRELSTAAPARALNVAADGAGAGFCGESATATPEAWLDCIAELEEAGLANLAQLERERLQQSFPEFELP